MIEAVHGAFYGSEDFVAAERDVLSVLRDTAYLSSVDVAKHKEPFPLYSEEYLRSGFIEEYMPYEIVRNIERHGIRNSHLTSIAPTGTISLCADNVSSGIEPVFSYETKRLVYRKAGLEEQHVRDYGVEFFGNYGKQAHDVTVNEHLAVLEATVPYIDSAVSKTCNVGPYVLYEDFKDIYMRAWEFGAKGCTTFRSSGKRAGILTAATGMENPERQEVTEEGAACYIDPETGTRSCDE